MKPAASAAPSNRDVIERRGMQAIPSVAPGFRNNATKSRQPALCNWAGKLTANQCRVPFRWCALRKFADQATEPILAQNAHTGHFRWRMRTTSRDGD
jgi:hypothetical protein